MESNDNPRCTCGHMIRRSHTINMKKTMKSGDRGKVYAKCNFCNCKELQIE